MSITFKRHYALLVLFAGVVLFFVLVFGDTRIIAYTTGNSDVAQIAVVNYDNGVDLFDDTMIHEIAIVMSPADYDTMIETYVETGEKDYFSADIIIDGVRVNNVGIRLKGNSTLFSLRPPGFEGNIPLPPGFDPDNLPPGFDGKMPFDPHNLPPGFDGQMPFDPDNLPPGFDGQMPFDLENLPPGFEISSFLKPQELPFLIKFDEYELGQRYQGYAEIALRVRGHSGDDALLSELLTCYLYDSAGQPAPQAAYAGISVNGEAASLYVVAEHIDELYVEKRFPGSDGVLYKAQLGGNFNYRGQDPTEYAQGFEQKTNVNDEDFAPLIEFIRFVNQATDEEFEQDLGKYLDVDSFATYLAINNLLVNMDSLGGNGNNYYLYYDLDSEQFTILVWDMNESFGQFWQSRDPNHTLDPFYGSVRQKDSDDFFADLGIKFQWNHPLKERFLASAPFRVLYKETYQSLFEAIYGEGLISVKIEQLSALFGQENASRDLFDQETYDAGVAHTNEFVSRREAFLLSLPLLRE
jgi:spore coat protein CotH